jgi:hypothetical protein
MTTHSREAMIKKTISSIALIAPAGLSVYGKYS